MMAAGPTAKRPPHMRLLMPEIRPAAIRLKVRQP